MAQFDHGGGCACGLQRECDCQHSEQRTSIKSTTYAVPTPANDNVPPATNVAAGYTADSAGNLRPLFPQDESGTSAGFGFVPVAEQPARRGDFMQTYSGKAFFPLDPRVQDVDIRDIAHSLALQCRYAGHCRRFYSVAEHSVLIARWLVGRADAETALWGLLHDASEAYLVDVPRPVKPSLVGYKEAEAKVMEVIAKHFGMPLGMPEIVHEADNRIIADEIVNMTRMPWHAKHDDPLGVPLMYWSPSEAEEEFLATFEALWRRAGDQRAVLVAQARAA
jgi:hypothetical protein